MKKDAKGLDSPDGFGDTESANSQYFLRKQAKPDKPKGESGFCFYIFGLPWCCGLVSVRTPKRDMSSSVLTIEPRFNPRATAI